MLVASLVNVQYSAPHTGGGLRPDDETQIAILASIQQASMHTVGRTRGREPIGQKASAMLATWLPALAWWLAARLSECV